MNQIINPVIPGFAPDPSLCKANGKYYIATSTFTINPGIKIYESNDLSSWNLISKPLTSDILNLEGYNPRHGIYAPNITYVDGLFYIVYVLVNKNISEAFLIKTKDFKEYSKPVFINDTGIDQSFFHDGNHSYVITPINSDDTDFTRITIQEWDRNENKLIGPINDLLKRDKSVYPEGPNLYKYKGIYYLTVAEGGTRFNHSNLIWRSNTLLGNYEQQPFDLISSKNNKELRLQKSGHASLVFEEDNIWLSCLATRPFDNIEHNGSPLGREAIIQRYKFDENGWLINYDGTNEPKLIVPVEHETVRAKLRNINLNFSNTNKLPLYIDSNRIGFNNWSKLTTNGLEISGQEDVTSLGKQSNILSKLESTEFDFSSKFKIDNSNGSKTGIGLRYDVFNQICFYVMVENNDIKLIVESYERSKHKEIFNIQLDNTKTEFELKITSDHGWISFSIDGESLDKMLPIDILFEESAECSFYASNFVLFTTKGDDKNKSTFKNMKVKYNTEYSVVGV